MKRVGIYIVLLSIYGSVWAAERSAEEALQIAGQLVHERVASGVRRAPARSMTAEIVGRGASYYAVKTGEGFVLVGADDRLQEVLGYADEGEFDATNENLMYWLGCYDEELANVDENVDVDENDNENEDVDENGVGRRVQGFTDAVAPLMKSKWNQSTPYNNLCPEYAADIRSVSGCVATAMAQVMYYHKWPVKGTGSSSYLWLCKSTPDNSKILSANYGETTYDWANMRDTYGSGYTSVQAAAVATLMYHCGVSVQMSYDKSSGAYTQDVPVALEKYFGYDPNYQRIRKELYPIDSLNQIIRAELRAGRPVLVSGSNDEGGHAFVCDGYDKRAYFHINWGWGGSSDGYYLLSALNPGSQGIGGTTKGYNKGTELYVGLQPKKSGTVRLPAQMGADSIAVDKLRYTRAGTITGTIYKLQNFGINEFSGYYGFGLYSEEEDKLVAVLKSSSYSLKAGYYRTSDATQSFTVPNTVPNGTYHLCAIYQESGKEWQRMMARYDEYFKTVYVTASSIEIMDNHAPAVLALASKISIPCPDSVPYTGVPVAFSIKNTGGTFRGDISARIYQKNFSRGQYEIVENVTIRRGETYSSALQQKFAESLKMGTLYRMKLCYRLGENDSWKDFTPTEYDEQEFTLYDPMPKLELLEQISFPDNSRVPKSGAPLSYKIKNSGADFRGFLLVAFRGEDGRFAYGSWSTVEVTIRTGETLEDSIRGSFDHTPGNYQAHLRYCASSESEFTLLGDSTQAIVSFSLYDDHPTPSAIEHRMQDADYDIYDLSGRPMNSDALPAGVYILRSRQDTTTRKIIIH